VKCNICEGKDVPVHAMTAYTGRRGVDALILNLDISGVPRDIVGGGGGSTNSVEDKGQGSGDCSPLARGSGGNCNFVQEISFHIVKSS